MGGNMVRQLSCLWGQLACKIFLGDWCEATDIILKLDEAYDSASLKVTKYEVVLNRAWLLHWALIVIFKAQVEDDKKHLLEESQWKLTEFFLQDKSLQIISIGCTHLYRYVAALLLLNKSLQDSRASELLNKIRQDRYWFSDPLTRLLEALYFDIDFDAAQEFLKEVGGLLPYDYFLADKEDEVKERCRQLIFETYCRIHRHINLSMIAEKLQMSETDAEIWIVRLIQQAKLDAKIDSETNRVVMTRQAPNIYQQVLDRTKNVALRSQLLNHNLDKRVLA